jgi:cysteine-rich repeat protein
MQQQVARLIGGLVIAWGVGCGRVSSSEHGQGGGPSTAGVGESGAGSGNAAGEAGNQLATFEQAGSAGASSVTESGGGAAGSSIPSGTEAGADSGAGWGGLDGAGAGSAVCGNAQVELGETCDDGNQLPDDGCDASCASEQGFVCVGVPSVCSHPSCVGLAKTCGPGQDSDCCAAPVVIGGTFNRGNDPGFPAKIADFRLDAYEISVGRFRKFVAGYAQVMIAPGAGKNPNNPADPGWNSARPMSEASLLSDVKCAASSTWSVGQDNLPMNCISWFAAEAFCIWDGGRLPTEAEWNYAAAGGAEQRAYPWGNTPPGANATHAVYGCYYPTETGKCGPGVFVAPVGSTPLGNGKWGHADLSGNLAEWVQDSLGSYSSNCDNCAYLSENTDRMIRGGAYTDPAPNILSSYRDSNTAAVPDAYYGARCARNAH